VKRPCLSYPLVGAALLHIAVSVLCPRVASAVGNLYIVDSTGDGDLVGSTNFCDDGTGHCTLRAAIQAANGHIETDGIRFSIPTTDPNYNGIFWTIHLTKPLPDLIESVNITGPGADKLTVRRNTGGNYRIFDVTTAASVNLSGMTIRDGNMPAGAGGGIANSNVNGTVNLSNCIITANLGAQGGGVANLGTMTATNCTLTGNSGLAGAFYNSGALTVTDCTVSGNSAAGGSGIGGAAIFNNSGTATINHSIVSANATGSAGSSSDAYGGGIYVNAGTVTLTECVLSDNSAAGMSGGGGGGGGNGFGGGAYVNAGTINVTNCAVSNNSARGAGTNGFGQGGGILNKSGTVNISNSTLSKNSSGIQGAGVYNDSILSVTNCTVTGNLGSGIFNNTGDMANIKSSIIASNGSGATPDLTGVFITQGFNLIGKNDGAAASFPAGNPNLNNDIVGTSGSPIDPKLDPNGLQDNGGSTPTIALLAGSPAIDQGTSNGLSTDQRGSGFGRTFDNPNVPNAGGGDGTDIGAFELQSSPTPTGTPRVSVSASPTTVNEGGDVILTVSASTVPSQSITVLYSVGGKAQLGTDFTLTDPPGQVVIPAGQSSATVTLHALTDMVAERNEKAKIKLLKGTGYKKSRPKKATVTIINVP
jgi:CSLREA domain-containing protein